MYICLQIHTHTNEYIHVVFTYIYICEQGKSVPIVKSPDNGDKMEENEIYAIETFGTTGRGWVGEV